MGNTVYLALNRKPNHKTKSANFGSVRSKDESWKLLHYITVVFILTLVFILVLILYLNGVKLDDLDRD